MAESPTQPGPPPSDPSRRSAEWMRDHLDAVYRYARRRLPAADAEDVAQQAFLGLFRADAAGRPPDDAGAYLLGAARRSVAGLFRRRARAAEPVGLPPGWEGLADGPLPDDVLGRQEMADLVHVALGLLPSRDRSTLLQFHRDGVPVAEIGRRDGTSEKAAEMRLRRARTAFRDRFLEVGRDWSGATAPDAARVREAPG